VFRKKSIDEWSLKYWLTQRYVNIAYRLYYGKFVSVNRSVIPRDIPVILAPNHQNALMDALVFVYDSGYQPVFLARADIFKGKWVIKFLTFLNIMPIFRMRDGIDNVRRNDEVFEKSLNVLLNKHNPLCLFPEGNHGDKRRLRPLVKGIFRIALLAQDAYGDKPGVKIVPVGLDYGHYQKFRNSVFVNYGNPIEVSEYYQLWKENPVNALNSLRERLSGELKKLMIHISTDEYYDLYMNLRIVYNNSMRKRLGIDDKSLTGRFSADKKMIEILDRHLKKSPKDIFRLNQQMEEYQGLLKQNNFRDWVIEKASFSPFVLMGEFILLIAMLPVFIYGFILNILPYYFPVYISRKKAQDPQFVSTVKFVSSMVLFPLMYMLWLIPAMIFIENTWLKLAFLISMPLTGYAAFKYYIFFKKLRAKTRFSLMRLIHNPIVERLISCRKIITDHMDLIINKYLS
jgi:1-acyl-sn-glycerol-3-phosphate acyltransferase